jgi:hypothetical protein
MFELIMILYVLPMVIVAIAHYVDKETRTIGDFLKFGWAMVTPVANLFVSCALLTYYISKFFINRYNLGEMWEKLMGKKIK